MTSATDLSHHNRRAAKPAPQSIFFSRTDKAAKIQAINAQFQEFSGHDWGNLIGASHDLLRHQATPKGVFAQVWQELSEGRVTSAYMCNRTADGNRFWVLALFVPVDDGFVSVQVPPVSPALEKVEKLYSELLEGEAADGAESPSGEALVAGVQALDYYSYETFMSEALSTEIAARRTAMGRKPEPFLTRFDQMARLSNDLRKQVDEMRGALNGIQTIPMNVRIIASRLEPEGGPITRISEDFQALSRRLASWLTDFSGDRNDAFQNMWKSLVEARTLFCAALLLEEAQLDCAGMDADAAQGVDPEAEATALQSVGTSIRGKATDLARSVEGATYDLGVAVHDLKRIMSSLQMSTILCKIEGERMTERHEGLDQVNGRMRSFLDAIVKQADRATELNQAIQSQAEELHGIEPGFRRPASAA
ncbi:aerotaxis receptor [Poseidonocella pacifica]|uniref:Aerotaxis receptor n=1 Tax=Poseidonocella pacifica TaxID=871651 RepID=A0A1I0XKC6_9RHOB|nr:PAS domain-containing protein [Poseidonocella pacifica]SFB00876.1 aerotaxis receptor [Poseidonocella pacifica]